MIRLLFILLLAGISWKYNETWMVRGISFALSFGALFFVDQFVLKKIKFYRILTTALTMSLMLLMLAILLYIFNIQPEFTIIKENPLMTEMILVMVFLLTVYLSLNYGGAATYFRKVMAEPEDKEVYLVDTSAIIDGRVLDVCKAGFLSRHLVIPEFVVREMQLIADSSIHEKRKKGRRGLSILRKIKESDDLSINIPTTDMKNIRGVDNKLLAMAKEQKANIISTDYNLIKVAEVEGIKVVNVNKLATILKPQHGVGEKVKVNITKKGNSKNQGVGYLDDDTMVVIDDGEKFINQSKMAIVTAYVQSETGKMLFCKLIN